MRRIRILGIHLLAWVGILACGSAFAFQGRNSAGNEMKHAESVVNFQWRGVNWTIPKKFYLGFRPYTVGDKEIWVQFGYIKSNASFVSANVDHDLVVDAHIRKIDNEDQKMALDVIHHIGLPFEKVPLFSAAKFNGMRYIGSSTIDHYFKLSNEDAYIECHMLFPDKLMPPKVSPKALNKEYVCNATYALPAGLYVWLTIGDCHLNDVARAFVEAHKKLLSFIH